MNVSLGSIEVDERTCRLIRKATFGISGRATRKEIKAWALATLAQELMVLEEIDEPSSTPHVEDEDEVVVLPDTMSSEQQPEQHTVIDLTEYIASNA